MIFLNGSTVHLSGTPSKGAPNSGIKEVWTALKFSGKLYVHVQKNGFSGDKNLCYFNAKDWSQGHLQTGQMITKLCPQLPYIGIKSIALITLSKS